MKRIIAAVAFAALAVPALADTQPFEQTELDRALPEINVDSASSGSTAAGARNLPFEQTQLDRAVPSVAEGAVEQSRKVTSFEQYNPV